MGYATQDDIKAPVPQYPNFEEALKAYQEEVKQIQARKVSLIQECAKADADISALLTTKSKLESDCASLKKNADALGEQIRREVLQAEQDIEGKRSVLAADLDKREQALKAGQDALLRGQNDLHAKRSEFADKEIELGKRIAYIANAEANMAIGRGNLEELTEKTLRLNSEALDLEADLMKKDAALKLVSEQLAIEAERQKKDKAALKQKAIELDALSDDLNSRAAEVSGLEEEKFFFQKTKADFEAARDKLATDQATFEAARDRLAVREMAVAEAESQMKNWENDLKQREEILAKTHKEK